MRSVVWIISMCLVALSCAAERPYVWANDVPQEAARQVTIRPGDRIFVLVSGQPTMTGEYIVSADGTVIQPVLGRIPVVNMSPDEVSRQVTARLKGMLVEPHVTVSVTTPRRPEINVVGEVSRPGHFQVDPGAGVLEAIARAGGLTEFADTEGIFVLRETPARMRVRFRFEDLTGGDAKSAAFELHDGDVVVVE